ncbi:MurR/RpiR family transcriptional regulator [Georgenia thermotolerans]|uniref:MurR/RpiR family transcriptional regulator n=1 Tax=Georgenia thermotolerans TaxID=527326 RepID=UPI001B8B318E|nr:MurR/RpiR family transcriptional regulator [Georgenia thermotolerans]
MTSENTVTGADVRERVRSHLPAFSPAERRVADVFLADPLGVIDLSVTQLAARAGSSPASVVRMCTSIGLRGFQDLKTRVALAHVPAAPVDALVAGEPQDAHRATVAVLRDTAAALESAAAVLDPAAVNDLVDGLLAARRIQLGAVGTSAPVAADAAYRLTTLGLDATFVTDVHAQHVSARMLGPGAVFLAVSHTGSTFETLAAARAAKAAGARVYVITSFASSPLTEIADVAIVAGSAETKVRVEALTSRLVHLTVLDAIFLVLKQRVAGAEEHLQATSEVLTEHRF